MSQPAIFRGPDFRGAVRLLESLGLPVTDLSAAHCLNFFYVGTQQAPSAVVGLEILGEVALLRSLAVDPDARGSGLGSRLVTHAEQQAREQGASRLYLLTTTARDFFAKRAYQSVARASAPEAIRQTREFSSLCPASSAFMEKRL